MTDRVFGLAVVIVALAYIARATQIETSFLSDPVGPKSFPITIGIVAALGGLVVLWRPDESPAWPGFGTLLKLAVATVVLVGYAYTLRPLGFLIPTAVAAAVISYQIRPRAGPAVITGVVMSGVLFLLFKYALGLGLFAFPRAWLGGVGA